MSYYNILPSKYHILIDAALSNGTFLSQQSTAGFILLCLFLILRPSPSTLVSIAPTGHHQKVSVILCTPHASPKQITSIYVSLKNGQSISHTPMTLAIIIPLVLSSIELEHEFFVVSVHLSSFSYQTRPVDSYHTLSYTHSCAESAYYALEHSHYSVVLVGVVFSPPPPLCYYVIISLVVS